MNRTKTRRLKVQKALPTGDGEFLAGWLNSDGWGYPLEAQQRLKSLLLQLSDLKERAANRLEIGEAELGPVNELLKQYPWVLQLFSKRSDLLFMERPAVPNQGHTWLGMLVALMSSGLLDRLRTCANCGCWFYARLPKAKYHSTSCRQAHFRSTAEFQKQNSEYQANYYRKHLSPNREYYRKGLSPAAVRELKRKARQKKGEVYEHL